MVKPVLHCGCKPLAVFRLAFTPFVPRLMASLPRHAICCYFQSKLGCSEMLSLGMSELVNTLWNCFL